MWAGIDFGSKYAGTTAVCYGNNANKKFVVGTTKKQDADEFIFSLVQSVKPEFVCIDAPLSLPGIYTKGLPYSNYFYREADIETKAMSPMFLGGLTARAMQLKSRLESIGIGVYEVYPAAFVKHFELEDSYHKKDKQLIKQFVAILQHRFDVKIDSFDATSWHHVDAIICWIISWRIKNGNAISIGNKEEGMIYI
jgi:predicted nuclease with RNAse H fold